MQVDQNIKDPPNGWSKYAEIYIDNTFRAVFVCSKCTADVSTFAEVFVAYDVTTLWEHIGERHADNLQSDEANEVSSDDEWDDSEVFTGDSHESSTTSVSGQSASVPGTNKRLEAAEADVIYIDSDSEREESPLSTAETRIPSVLRKLLAHSSTNNDNAVLKPAFTIPCDLCRCRMQSNVAYLRHKVRFHTEGVTAYYTRCEICLELIFKPHFKRHITQHNVNFNMHRCVLCQGYYHGRSRMLMHYIKIHNLFDTLTAVGSATPRLIPILVPPRQDSGSFRSPKY